MKLTAGTLADIDTVATPNYDRSKLSCGIVHFGVGGFHRAHQAMYVDALLAQGEAFDWAICGVGVMKSDARMRDVMAEQDCLYTLAVRHADGTWDTRVIGSIIEYLFAPDDPDAVIEKMASPEIRIVSLTVTEGGYNFSATTGEFDETDPGVVADLQPDAVPATTFGLICAALSRRKERGLEPFTIMSCDNIQENGHIARSSFTTFARLKDPALAEWIEAKCAFPNSMVDRITPATSPELIDEVAERFGIEDQWPVPTEPFTQWVLEDHFTLGRPPFQDAGVQVVDEVAPYELMKLRLLNASHQALCYFGYLCGYRLVHEVVQDPAFAAFLLAYMDDEATPTLLPVPGVDLAEYKHTLIERFANPEIRDNVSRLCAESSDRIPKWLLPVIRRQLELDGPITLSAAIVASWARYDEAIDEEGEPIEIVDRLKATLVPLALRNRTDPTAFIRNQDVFGDLADDERFVAEYVAALNSLHANGARATLQNLIA
ncbi:mannitol dehydrogenase family protein [Antrihabitans cavernicola]|uniref:Mannitol dehydrogenase family protein n=1 Tax=Antrihabitans cavernicola TaxID=2495913 RepID=A0A5A7SEY0_9NOCA|nr:mannitol dehydrogenase family protein [Spelaeibacter cavernicola]KAA0023085.1 mannitol dehydrogenase family protein [Spelaeibacter cavernicola]